MRLSQERISHLAHVILDRLVDKGLVFVAEDDEPACRRGIKRIFLAELERQEDLDRRVREKIASYRRSIPEGSDEWRVLYERFSREEKARRGGV